MSQRLKADLARLRGSMRAAAGPPRAVTQILYAGVHQKATTTEGDEVPEGELDALAAQPGVNVIRINIVNPERMPGWRKSAT